MNDICIYTGGDAQKLHELSIIWSEYYECCVNMSDTLTPDGRLPPISTMAYIGAAVFLKCNLCLSPEDKRIVEWWYSPVRTNSLCRPLGCIIRSAKSSILHKTVYPSSFNKIRLAYFCTYNY